MSPTDPIFDIWIQPLSTVLSTGGLIVPMSGGVPVISAEVSARADECGWKLLITPRVVTDRRDVRVSMICADALTALGLPAISLGWSALLVRQCDLATIENGLLLSVRDATRPTRHVEAPAREVLIALEEFYGRG